MTTFMLSARRDGYRTQYVHIEAETSREASIEAIYEIMDRANKSTLWAKGEITLTCGDTVLQRMPAKP